MSSSTIDETVRSVLADHARLTKDASAIDADADLYAAGLTSHASVAVMLGIEDAFDVEFTPDLMKRSTFGSVADLVAAVEGLDPSVEG